MPITTEWDTPAQIAVRITYVSPWTWEDFHKAVQDVAALVSEVDYKICLIYDAVKSTSYPSSNVLHHYRKGLIELAPYVKLHVGYGFTTFTQKAAPIIFKVMGGSIYYVDSLEEARQLIADTFEVEG